MLCFSSLWNLYDVAKVLKYTLNNLSKGIFRMRRRTFCKTSAIATISAVTAVTLGSCSPSSSGSTSRDSNSKPPLKIGISPWIGWGEAHIAYEKGFYKAEGVEVEHVVFQSITDIKHSATVRSS